MSVADPAGPKFLKQRNLLVVLGPTASGKTGLAVRLARGIGGEVISADSRQVYRGMDLGTGKDLDEYGHGDHAVPFHLIDIRDPSEEFSVFNFQQLFHECFQGILNRRRVPVLVGGTGLYLDAVLREYRMVAVPENPELRQQLDREDMASLRQRLLRLHPETHNTTDLLDRNRLIRAIEIADFSAVNPESMAGPITVSPLIIGIRLAREELRRRITRRLQQRLEAGMIDEVQRLHEQGIPWQRLESFGLEYRYLSLFLQQRISREEMVQWLNTRIHQFAKRQETWFRRMEKNGVHIHWIDGADETAALGLMGRLTE